MGSIDDTYNEFLLLYKANKSSLAEAQKELNKRLKNLIQPLKDSGYRVRHIEQRIKDAPSLYKKVVEDKIPFKKVFELGEVRDIIGGRIVCHNLVDLKTVAIAVKQRRTHFTALHPKGDDQKWWIEKPSDTGYRGAHIDVEYEHKGTKYQAEIQILTILQDAWARFSHTDIYKYPDLFPKGHPICLSMMYFSDMLFSIDQSINLLRNYTEDITIGPTDKIKLKDAAVFNMASVIAFFGARFNIPTYKEVTRIDRYTVTAPDVHYRHSVSTTASRAGQFEILIGGDTKTPAAREIRLFKELPKPEAEVSKKHVKIKTLNDRILQIKTFGIPSQKAHCYRLECLWRGLFQGDVAYFFTPWYSYYKMPVNYTLEVTFAKKLKKPPQIYEISGDKEPHLIGEFFDDFLGQRKLGNAMLELSPAEKGKVTYYAKYPKLNCMVLCLFRIDDVPK